MNKHINISYLILRMALLRRNIKRQCFVRKIFDNSLLLKCEICNKKKIPIFHVVFTVCNVYFFGCSVIFDIFPRPELLRC